MNYLRLLQTCSLWQGHRMSSSSSWKHSNIQPTALLTIIPPEAVTETPNRDAGVISLSPSLLPSYRKVEIVPCMLNTSRSLWQIYSLLYFCKLPLCNDEPAANLSQKIQSSFYWAQHSPVSDFLWKEEGGEGGLVRCLNAFIMIVLWNWLPPG